MARPKEPIQLVLAKGNSHLTKEEIEERKRSEVQPVCDEVEPPSYLTAKQKKEFAKYAEQLKKLRIIGETDVDILARYIMSQDLYIKLTKQLSKREVLNDPFLLDKYIKNQDKAFKQCQSCARELGLTIASRCKLVVPQTETTQKKENKFDKFRKVT